MDIGKGRGKSRIVIREGMNEGKEVLWRGRGQ